MVVDARQKRAQLGQFFHAGVLNPQGQNGAKKKKKKKEKKEKEKEKKKKKDEKKKGSAKRSLIMFIPPCIGSQSNLTLFSRKGPGGAPSQVCGPDREPGYSKDKIGLKPKLDSSFVW